MERGVRSGELFSSLHKWAKSQDENFTTDAFAYVLRCLVHFEPTSAQRILRLLMGWGEDLRCDGPENVRITTQEIVEEGRPDILIDAPPGHFGYVEVKLEAGLGPNQLRRYRAALERQVLNHNATRTLVLLTRYRLVGEADVEFVSRRWHEVGSWLDAESNEIGNDVCRYMVREFVGFLRERWMMIEQVKADIVPGLASLINLGRMIAVALEGEGMKVFGPAAGSAVDQGGGQYGCSGQAPEKGAWWIGLGFDRPTKLDFRLTSARPIWRREFDLNQERFWSLEKEGQKTWIESHLRAVLEEAAAARLLS
jgi:hypothetical protein